MDKVLSEVQEVIQKHLVSALAAPEPPLPPVSPPVFWPQRIHVSQLAQVVCLSGQVDLRTRMCMLGIGIQCPARENISMRTGRNVHSYVLPLVVKEIESAECEVPVSREFGDITLVGRADLVVGDWVIEFKTTSRSSTPSNVARLQVSLYASLLGKRSAIMIADLRRRTVNTCVVLPSNLLPTAEGIIIDYSSQRGKITRGNCASCGLSQRCTQFLVSDDWGGDDRFLTEG